MKLKNILLLSLSLVLVAALAIGGTVAYLQDDDSDVNVMTLGNVKIEQHEYERVVNSDGTYKTDTIDGVTSYVLKDFTQGKPLLPCTELDANGQPYNYGAGDWDSTATVRMTQVGSYGSMDVFESPNAQDKFVVVENTGKTDAYVRTIVAFEVGTADPDLFDYSYHIAWAENYIGVATIDGNQYYVVEFIYRGMNAAGRHTGGILPAGETSYPSLSQVYMKATATNEDCEKIDGNGNGTYDILVFSQAVQAAGFADAETALNAGFGDITTTSHPWADGDAPVIPVAVSSTDELKAALAAGDSVVLTENIADAPVNTKAPYGNYYGVALNGGVLDGNGNSLDFNEGELNNGSLDNYGIMVSAGTIKNVDITGVFRGIVIMNPTDDIYIDNVTIGGEDVCYAINTAEGDGTHSLIVTNSTIAGWNSYGTAIKDLSFTNCTFAQGEYYTDVFGRLVKPYVTTVFENCEFSSKYYIDLSALEDGCTITLKNCTVNGVKLTAENWKDLIVAEDACGNGQISIEGKDGTYMSTSNIFDYVTIE